MVGASGRIREAPLERLLLIGAEEMRSIKDRDVRLADVGKPPQTDIPE